jgi:hypothetical protein
MREVWKTAENTKSKVVWVVYAPSRQFDALNSRLVVPAQAVDATLLSSVDPITVFTKNRSRRLSSIKPKQGGVSFESTFANERSPLKLLHIDFGLVLRRPIEITRITGQVPRTVQKVAFPHRIGFISSPVRHAHPSTFPFCNIAKPNLTSTPHPSYSLCVCPCSARPCVVHSRVTLRVARHTSLASRATELS